MVKTHTLAPLHVIDDLGALRVLADPLRNHILELLILDPMPVKQIAQRLGLAPNKLYYHVNLMEEHGLIEVTDTRMVSGILEKTYRSVAHSFTVDRSLLSATTGQGRESLHSAISAVIDSTRDDLLRTIEIRYAEDDPDAPPKRRSAMVNRSLKRLTEADARRFRRRLQKLVEDFESAPEPDPQAQTFALTIAYYPSFYFAEEETSDES